MNDKEIINWLLKSDVSIQYQVHRDLLSNDQKNLQSRITSEGWGKQFLAKQNPGGHWGQRFYQPKWISSHYTILDLRNLCVDPGNNQIKEVINKIAREERGPDGGIHPAGSTRNSDVCINGMFLNYASYFKTDVDLLKLGIDFILTQKMPDGGFNCTLNRSGARHSSLHTTISTIEGIAEYEKNGYNYRLEELKEAESSSREFILQHQLFLSDKTGEIINKNFLRLAYPGRWYYDILRALDYFQYSNTPWDDRMQPAIDVILKKRNKDQTWNLQAKHPGQQHIEMEKAGKPSRLNTLRAMRVLKHFELLSFPA